MIFAKLRAIMNFWKKESATSYFYFDLIKFPPFTFHRMSNMSDSAYGEDYESSGSPGGVTMHKIQKSSRWVAHIWAQLFLILSDF